MTDNDPNADQVTYWNEVAGAKWVANQARLDRLFTPLTAALLEAAAPKPGERVLDVGCGCGETALIAAARVGSSGHVMGVDLSKPMLDHAAVRAPAGVPVTWLQADAMTHGFAPEADLMMSRFGVMFFADPLAAFTNLRRALKPGARVALICWRPRDAVEWMQWPLDQVASILPPPAPTTGEPGPFGFADAEATMAMFRRAGFSDVTATPVDADVTLGTGADPVGEAMGLMLDTGPCAVLFREAEPDARALAAPLLRRAVEARLDHGVVRLGAACWVYRGVA